jgi:hypothetical protein
MSLDLFVVRFYSKIVYSRAVYVPLAEEGGGFACRICTFCSVLTYTVYVQSNILILLVARTCYVQDDLDTAVS